MERSLVPAILAVVLGASLEAGAEREPARSRARAPEEEPPASALALALDRALERAQRRLEDEIVLWEDHSRWENPWVVRGAHHVVHTTDGHALGKRIAEGQATMLGHFQRVLGSDHVPTQPFTVHVHPTQAAYNAFGEANGDEHSSFYGSFFAAGLPGSPVVTYREANETLLQMFVTHSALHQFVAAAFPGAAPALPTWVAEGLASCFALYWDTAYGAAELRRLVAEGRFLPLAQLMREGTSQYLADPHTRLIELGMLFLHLLHYREDTRLAGEGEEPPAASCADWLQRLHRGEDVSGHPFQALLASDLDLIEAELMDAEF